MAVGLCVSIDIGTPEGVGDSGYQERQGKGCGVPEHDEEGHTSNGNRGMGTDCGVWDMGMKCLLHLFFTDERCPSCRGQQ